VGNGLYSIYYVVKENTREITTGIVFVTRDNYSKILNDTLNEIIRSLKRVEEAVRSAFRGIEG